MTVGKNNKLRLIFNNYGEQNQLVQLEEELCELLAEVRCIYGKSKIIGNSDFLGEVADVLVMCEQFRLKYNNINSIVDFKINRQIKRINKE